MFDRTFEQFGRALVDMDATQTLRYKVLVERKWFALFYFCTHCKKIGHIWHEEQHVANKEEDSLNQAHKMDQTGNINDTSSKGSKFLEAIHVKEKVKAYHLRKCITMRLFLRECRNIGFF